MRRQATEKMMRYAEAISHYLGIKMPETTDFVEIHAFIDEWADEFLLQQDLDAIVMESAHGDYGDRD